MSPIEPDLPIQDLPKMIPDREDIASRRKHKTEYKAPKVPNEPTPKESGSIWSVLSFIILFLIAGYLFWQNSQFNQWLELSAQEISLSNARIRVLEEQLSATGDNMVMNEASIKAQFGNHMGEIRKLWDVTNKRNKVWITDNQTNIKKLQSGAATATTKLDQLGAAFKQTEQAVKNSDAKMSSGFMEASSQLATAEQKIRSNQVKINELSLEQNLMLDQLRLNDVSQLTKKQAELGKRIDALSNQITLDIESINSHRLQVNQRLTSLQDQLMALENQFLATPLTSSQ